MDYTKISKQNQKQVSRFTVAFTPLNRCAVIGGVLRQTPDSLRTAIFRTQRDVEHGERLIQNFEEAIKMYFGRPLMEVRKNPPPERILPGETRVSQRRGVIHAKRVDGGRLYREDERGYGSKMSTREWRLLPKQEVEEEDLALPNEAAAQDDAAAEGELNQLSHSHLRRDG